MSSELKATLKGNWLVITIAILSFSFILWFYPNSDMGKQQKEEMKNNEVGVANILYQEGFLTKDERNKVWQKYGVTEDDIYPLRRYIEESN